MLEIISICVGHQVLRFYQNSNHLKCPKPDISVGISFTMYMAKTPVIGYLLIPNMGKMTRYGSGKNDRRG